MVRARLEDTIARLEDIVDPKMVVQEPRTLLSHLLQRQKKDFGQVSKKVLRAGFAP